MLMSLFSQEQIDANKALQAELKLKAADAAAEATTKAHEEQFRQQLDTAADHGRQSSLSRESALQIAWVSAADLPQS